MYWINSQVGGTTATNSTVVLTMPKLGDPCARCHDRKSEIWVSESPIALAHGLVRPWCDQCAAKDEFRSTLGMLLALPSVLWRLRPRA